MKKFILKLEVFGTPEEKFRDSELSVMVCDDLPKLISTLLNVQKDYWDKIEVSEENTVEKEIFTIRKE